MGRFYIVCWGLLASLCLVWGCGTAGRMNPMAWFGSNPAKGRNDDPKIASRSPFKHDGGREKGSDTPSDRDDDRQNTQGSAAGEKGVVTHDINTLRLISDELRDADQVERAELADNLKRLNPALVRQILQLRRTRIQLEQEHRQLAEAGIQNSNRRYHGLGEAYPGDPIRENPVSLAGQSPATADGFQFNPIDSERFSNGHGTGSFEQQRQLANSKSLASGKSATAIDRRLSAESYGHSQGSLNRPPVADPGLRITPTGMTRGAAIRVASPAAGESTYLQTPTINLSRGFPPGPGPRTGTGGTLTHPDPLGYRASGNLQRGFGSPQYPTSPGPETAQWNDDLARLILLAEQQAGEAQAAWEQAELADVGPGGDINRQRTWVESLKQNYVERQVHLRWLYLMAGRQAHALDRILGLEPADQEFWSQMFWSVANYFDTEGIPDQDLRAAQTVTQLRSAIQRLQENAQLEIRNVSFCSKIASYGNFESFSSDEFRRKQRVLIYAEVENFTSEQGSDGQYSTQLKSTIEIHKEGPHGGLVKQIEFPATTDLCRNHRRDYFHSYEIQVPAKTTLGPHVVSLIIEDELSKKVATYSRNFTVVDRQ